MAAPVVTAQAAVSIDYRSETLNGTSVTQSKVITSYGFNLGLDTSYGTTITVASADIVDGATFTAPATGLVENTTYHFRSFAVNADGTGVSADRTFTTPLATAVSVAALSTAVVSRAKAVVVARTANRITLLKAALNQASVPPTTSVGELAASFTEVRAAAAFLAGASNLDSQLAVLRVHDSTGAPLTGVLANIPSGQVSTWGASLVTSEASVGALEAEALLTA